MKCVSTFSFSNDIYYLQRFLPSDFGVEEDRVHPLPPFQAFLDKKRKIRREIEAAKIPYTFVSANCFGAYFVNFLLHPYERNKDIAIYGNGETKGTYLHELRKNVFFFLFIK